MANQGAAEYDNPDWLKAKIDEQSNKFIADFRTVFEDGDPGNAEGALEINKDFDTADAYFDAIRMKFAGNLLEAVMAAFFNHANVSDGRLQPFAVFESSFGGEDGVVELIEDWTVENVKRVLNKYDMFDLTIMNPPWGGARLAGIHAIRPGKDKGICGLSEQRECDAFDNAFQQKVVFSGLQTNVRLS